MEEEKITKVRVIQPWEQLKEKHPVGFLILMGVSLIGVGCLFSIFIVGMIIGIPLIILGVIFLLAGILGLFGKFVPKGATGKTKKIGLFFPKSWRSKELQ